MKNKRLIALTGMLVFYSRRLGQSKNVYIYKLSIDGTVEQRILALQVRAYLCNNRIKNVNWLRPP